MTTQEQRKFLFPKAYNAALRAGAAILEIYEGREKYEITIKEDHSPLTEADCRAHNIIKDYLSRTHIPLMSEEGRTMLYKERMGWDLFWMVDPLDGTKEFIKGNGEFTVNIALMADNKPVMSVIYVPYKGKIYLADEIFGAFMKDGVFPEEDAEYNLEEIVCGARRLPLTDRANSPLRVAISRSHNTEKTFELIDQIRAKYPDLEVVEQGSSYKFCLLAEGTVDCYVRTSPTMEWDTSAGELILAMSGGATLKLADNQPLKYNEESLVNPDFYCLSKFMPEVPVGTRMSPDTR